jgi:hypothetical protein
VKLGFPEVAGPIGAWITLDFDWNTKDSKQALKNSINFTYKDWNVGEKLEYDLNSGKLNNFNT